MSGFLESMVVLQTWGNGHLEKRKVAAFDKTVLRMPVQCLWMQWAGLGTVFVTLRFQFVGVVQEREILRGLCVQWTLHAVPAARPTATECMYSCRSIFSWCWRWHLSAKWCHTGVHRCGGQTTVKREIKKPTKSHSTYSWLSSVCDVVVLYIVEKIKWPYHFCSLLILSDTWHRLDAVVLDLAITW